MNAWIVAAIGVPLLLLLGCLSAPVRLRLPAWLPLAPVPALLAAVFGASDLPLVLGNARFALVFAFDAPGRVLLGCAALLWIAAGACANDTLRDRHASGSFVVCWLMTLTGCVGVFLAADVVGFYFLLAVLSVGASGLVLQGQGPDALRAGAVYLGVALLAEAFLLAALVLLVQGSPDGSLLIADVAQSLATSPERGWTVSLLLIGLGMKAGLVPMHFWMPWAYAAAPIPAAAVMSGAVVKASILALLRLLPSDIALPEFGLPLAALGLLGALAGALVGLTQTRPKVVLAYSSVSQMGFILAVLGMGLASGDAATSRVVTFYAVHHLLVKGGLFLWLGVVPLGRSPWRWPLWLPAAFLALGLAGLPLTGGALAKYAAKDVLGNGAAYWAATVSSITSTWLMLHFLRRAATVESEPDPVLVRWPWWVMAVASVAVPGWLYFAMSMGDLAQAFAPAVLWSSLWPVLAGAALALAFGLLRRDVPFVAGVPAGDIGVALQGLGRAGARLGQGLQGIDAVARRWPVASVSLLLVVAVFYWTIRP
ncbi:MAG TPA: proton-conducting transporter membrane subunit [Stenotrophomonas sp.]|jgi:formate hydrogenlyase subunit 3/multisubunit Na+/H+ antiporter MnhD subunit